MAVNREPILKRCKSLGISPAVMGIAKETKRDPNANKRKKVSRIRYALKESRSSSSSMAFLRSSSVTCSSLLRKWRSGRC